MAGSGSGPSRRSHTKSRKGCKTCKRRHIRCDETFPQCRNCTKHQVRCDYLDEPGSQQTSPTSFSAEIPSPLPWTPEIEATINLWEQSGQATLRDGYSIDLQSHDHTYSHTDLHLLYFALGMSQSSSTGQYTIWESTNQHFWSQARHHPYLTHALLAFTASYLAWEYDSPEIKNLAYQHGSVALRGLQEGVANLSAEDADALFLTSMLLSWQANDWRSWLSLTNGIRSVVSTMTASKISSRFPRFIEEQTMILPDSLSSNPPSNVHPQVYQSTLQQVQNSLETLQPYIAGRKEAVWIDQIKEYVDRLMAVAPPATPDEQFNYLYVFRKYLFWVPSLAMKSPSKDTMTIVVMAYLYSTALQLEALFPEIAPSFCTRLAARPLAQIIQTFDSMSQADMGQNQQLTTLRYLMQAPRHAMNIYRPSSGMPQRQMSFPEVRVPDMGMDAFSTELDYSMNSFLTGQKSPGFGPVPHHQRMSSDTSSSVHNSPYLAVPSTQYPPAAMTLPSMPASSDVAQYDNYAPMSGGFETSGGFVAPQMLWT